MRSPVVGLPTYPPDAHGRYYLASEYVRAVHRAGGVPILFPPVGDHSSDWLDRIDALLVPGGGDVDPLLYGETAHEAVYGVNPTRDATEIALVRAALDRNIPTLLICRGMQLLNVALGGTLHQHVPEAFGDAVPHRAPERRATAHKVRIEPGTRLSSILGVSETEVVSFHHQAVRDLAPSLKPSAYAPDGLLEACEVPGRWFVAVQWHPEESAEQDAVQRRLFEGLIAAAGRQRAAA